MTALFDATAELSLLARVSANSEYKVAYPNIEFTPEIDTPYYEVSFLSVPSVRLGHGTADRHIGIMQIDAVVPIKKGHFDALVMARIMQVLFDRVKITTSGVTLEVISAPTIGGPQQDADWYKLPVSITYTIMN